MKKKYEPCAICEEYIEGVDCTMDQCPVAKLKAENERLNHIRAELSKEIDKLRDMVAQNEGVLPRYEQLIKTEANKEFAEKLKTHADYPTGVINDGLWVSVETIDALAKETTEGEDESIS